MDTTRPAIGMTYDVRGRLGTIIAVHPFGTIDVRMDDGATYRVSGLPFI